MRQLRTFLCGTHSLLDGDDAGRNAFAKAERDGLVSVANSTHILIKGFKQAEFEDCIDLNVYRESVLQDYGVDLNKAEFKGNEKWSTRIRDCFMSQGKDMNDSLLGRVKFTVAKSIEKTPETALHPMKRGSIDALVAALENALAAPHGGA